MKKLLEQMSQNELRMMLWKARYIRFRGKIKRNAETILVYIGLITLPIALYFHIKTGAIIHIAGWTAITVSVGVFFSIKRKREDMGPPNAHWVSRTQPRK